MPESRLTFLLDQNIPQPVTQWLRERLPACAVHHVNALGLAGQTDQVLYEWAQREKAVIVTYDEDFADAHFHSHGQHAGVVRLRVWPTTIEETQQALQRVLDNVPLHDIARTLVIVDNRKIRFHRHQR